MHQKSGSLVFDRPEARYRNALHTTASRGSQTTRGVSLVKSKAALAGDAVAGA